MSFLYPHAVEVEVKVEVELKLELATVEAAVAAVEMVEVVNPPVEAANPSEATE